MLVRWYATELVEAAAVLDGEERVEFTVSHNDGLLLLTSQQVVIQYRGRPVVALPYREINGVETEAGQVWSHLVLRVGRETIELDGMTSAEVRRAAETVRARCVVEPPASSWRFSGLFDRDRSAGPSAAEPLDVPAAAYVAPEPVVNSGDPFAQPPAAERPPDAASALPSESSGPEPGPGLGTFEIHALGPQGSGKTVFMAALYEQLRIRRAGYMFNLRSDYDSSVRLNAVYNNICDVDAGWPPSTKTSAQWEFTACVRSEVGDFEPLRFRYLDYPGGILTSPRGAQDPNVRENIARLRSANALLILLDGQAMLALMEGEPSGRRYLSFELTSSLEIAQQSRCPIHFVITKWDLVGSRYTLAQVREQLMKDHNFHDLVEARAQDSSATIRLFPVSAVGFDYATVDEYGAMRKLGAQPRPYNVDLPLFSVLPDFLTFAQEEISKQQENLAQIPVPEQSEGRLSPKARKVSAAFVRDAIMRRFPLFALVPPVVVEQAIAFGDRLLSRRRKGARVAAKSAEALLAQRRAVDSESAALELLMQQCEQVVAEFEEAEPASVLTGGLTAAATGVRAS